MNDTHRYQRAYRRVLIDTQIPDWNPQFLAHYDPAATVQAARDAAAQAIMVYFQSHTGLCNWPVSAGRQHQAFSARDVMAETLEAADALGMPVCAYYSVNFNNEAWRAHPEWRFLPATDTMIGGGVLVRERYGICCFNNRRYVDFVREQVCDLLDRYTVDAFFYDMVWWMGVCLCDSCRARYRHEENRDIPDTINWLDADWCRFQAARERWLTQFAHELRDLAHESQPGIAVYHNFALGIMDWTRGVSFDSAAAHDFLGGDFYGGRDEQMIVSRLMSNLSETRPVEFMTTVTTNLAQHETLKPAEHLQQECLAAAANASSSLMIASIDPDGGIHAPQMQAIADAFAARTDFDTVIGGKAVEQIAVYFSGDSKMNFNENGARLRAPRNCAPADYPHLHAVRGACNKLQRAHLTFGVISRRNLDALHEHDVVILPNVLRIRRDETDALRKFVADGGRLYCSRYTSLTSTDGSRHDDFLLADLFGCHFDSVESGRMVHVECSDADCRAAIAPQRVLTQEIAVDERSGMLRLLKETDGVDVLATLNLPFAHPSAGSIEGNDWASIHSSPPWTPSEIPVVVRNRVGKGEVIYSAADIETGASQAHERLFVSLVLSLLPDRPPVEVNAHPSIWMTAYDQPDNGRTLLSLLSMSAEWPLLPSNAGVRMAPPAGTRYTSICMLPRGAAPEFTIDDAGAVKFKLTLATSLTMVAAYYEESV